MKTLVVLDIDGTIADATERFEAAGPEPERSNKEEYLSWLDRIQDHGRLAADRKVPGMVDLAAAIGSSPCTKLIYLTSREEKYRTTTHKWLVHHRFPNATLYMRPTDDWRSGAQLKEDFINIVLSNEDVWMSVVVIDDDQNGEIEKICKKNSWTFLKARSGGTLE